MKHRQIRRLLDAAAAARSQEEIRLPAALQSRILLRWRAARLERDRLDLGDALRLLRVFRLGLGCACVATALIVAFSLAELRSRSLFEPATPVTVLNLALRP